jgi:benzaldehyde dehydrogenase (NAD)
MAVATELEPLTGTLITEEHLDGRVYNGSWKNVGGRLEVDEPATGEKLFEIGSADRDDVFAAATEAAAAQPGWAATPGPERAALLHATADALEAHREQAERWLIRETGVFAGGAAHQVDETLKELRVAAALTSRPNGELLPNEQGRTSIAQRLPLGVVGVITPWNYPLLLAMRSIAPALALGNAVLLKSDPHASISSGLVLARIFEEAGLPEGVLHVLPGGIEAGEAICDAPEVAMVSFTGSTRAGRQVGAKAGGNLKRVALELGGKSSFIVLEDADIDKASSCGAFGSFYHQGQICMASGRHIVHESIADAYTDAMVMRAKRLPVGDPARDEVVLGPIINRKQFDHAQEIVTEAAGDGAEVLAGGDGEAPFFPPTVLGGVTGEMRAWNEEIFGPVAVIRTFSDQDEAIAMANDTEYGLSAGVYTADKARGRVIADALDTGCVHIGDQTIYDDQVAPFGGTGISGNGGRFGGDANLDEFTQWRWITERDEPASYPF